MFDEIQCKVPLPAKRGVKTAAEWKGYTFQTKDLDNFLGHYEIRKSGLWVKEVEYKKPTPNKKRQKEKNWLSDPLEIESEKWVKESFTGYVQFYTFIHDIDNEHDLWVEFGAHFDKGKLQDKVELLKWEKETNAERKANTREWEEKASLRKEYENKWRYKYCFKHWNRLVGWVFRGARRIYEWKGKLVSWRVESWFKF